MTSSFEKTVNAVLLLILFAIGIGPFLLAATRAAHIEASALPFSVAFSLLVVGLIYDACERVLGKGRGIYSTVILCSTPALGIISSDPAWLGVAGIAVVNGLLVWLASSARGSNRSPLLMMLSMMLLGSGFLLGFSPFIFLLLIPVAIASDSHDSVSWKTLGFGCTAILIGALLRGFFATSFMPELAVPMVESNPALHVAYALPWSIWMMGPLLANRRTPHKIFVCSTAMVVIAVSAIWSTSVIAVIAIAAPGCAYVIAQHFQSRFSELVDSRRRGDILAATLLLGAILAVYFLLRTDSSATDRQLLIAACASLFALLAAVAAWRKLPRWTIAVTAISGLMLGALCWQVEASEDATGSSQSISLWPPFIVGGTLSLALWIAYKRSTGPAIPAELLKGSAEEFRFAGRNFFRMDKTNSDGWSGEAATLELEQEHYTFAVFGDVTGSESPVGTRQGGYLVFRRLASRLNSSDAAFAISLGDLASKANEPAFRRARAMLKKLRTPIAAVPGNHDLVCNGNYDGRFFQALFKADNSEFVAGSVQFILLNNGWGSIRDIQWEWLEQVLAASKSRFKLVFCHKPVFDPRSNGIPYAMEWRPHAERLHELFVRSQVTLVLSGHIHALLHEQRDGVHYVVSGGGGSKLVEANAQHHFLLIDIRPEQLSLRAIPLLKKNQSGAAPMLELTLTA